MASDNDNNQKSRGDLAAEAAARNRESQKNSANNKLPDFLKELRGVLDILNKNINSLPSELATVTRKINDGTNSQKDLERISDLLEDLDKDIVKSLDKNISKLLKWKLKNQDSAKKINDLKSMSLNINDKEARNFSNVLEEIEKRAADGEYNVGQLAKRIKDIDFSSARSGSDLLSDLNKSASDCGVSISTLGVNFDNSGKRMNIFNENAERGFNEVKKLRDQFDKCSAGTFAFGLAVYQTSKKLMDIHDNYKDVISKTIEYRRSLQMLSGASPDLIPGGAKALDDIRKNMNLTREETVKFAQVAQELRGTTYSINDLNSAMQGMKQTIGEVDVSQLEKLAGIMKSIPKEQLDAFAKGEVGTNANAAVLNMIKSGKTQDVDSLITSGALGKTAAQAAGVNISSGDKGYLNSKRLVNTIGETAQNQATDLSGAFLKYLPLLGGIGTVAGMAGKIYGQLGMFKGGIQAVQKIASKDAPRLRNTTKIISNDVKKIALSGTSDSLNPANMKQNLATQAVEAAKEKGSSKAQEVAETTVLSKVSGKHSKLAKSEKFIGFQKSIKLPAILGGIAIAGGGLIGAIDGYQKSLDDYQKDLEFWGTKANLNTANTTAAGALRGAADVGTMGMSAGIRELLKLSKTNTEKEAGEKTETVDRMMGNTISNTDIIAAGAVASAVAAFIPLVGPAIAVALSAGTGVAVAINEDMDNKELRKIYENIYDARKHISDLKVLNAEQNQHFKRQATQLDGILNQIKNGVFSAVENLNTMVSLDKMENSFLFGLNKDTYESSSNTAQKNSLISFNKSMRELNKQKNIIGSDVTMTLEQKTLLLAQITQQEIEIRKKFQQDFTKSLSLKNIPEVIEGELTKRFNTAIMNMNGRGNSFYGSTEALTSKMGQNSEVSFKSFTLQAEKFIKNISAITQRDKKNANEQTKNSDAIVNTFFKPSPTDNQSLVDTTQGFFKSFSTDLITGFSKRFSLSFLMDKKNNRQSILGSTFTSDKEIQQKGSKVYTDTMAVFNDPQSTSKQMEKAQKTLINTMTAMNMMRSEGSEQGKVQIKLVEKQLKTSVQAKKIQEQYSKELRLFRKDSSSLTPDDIKSIIQQDQGFAKELSQRGYLDEGGNLKDDQLDNARVVYADERNKKIQGIALKELSSNKLFKQAMGNVTDITTATKEQKNEIFAEYKRLLDEETQKTAGERLYKNDVQKSSEFDIKNKRLSEDTKYFRGRNNFSEEDTSRLTDSIYNALNVSDIMLNNDQDKEKTETYKLLQEQSNQLKIVEGAIKSGKGSVKIGKEVFSGEKLSEIRAILFNSVSDLINQGQQEKSGAGEGQIFVSAYEAVEDSGKKFANSLYDNAQNIEEFSTAQKGFMDAINNFTKVLEQDANILRKEIKLNSQKANLISVAWSGNGNIGEEREKTFQAEFELNRTKLDTLDKTREKIIGFATSIQNSGFEKGLEEHGKKVINKDFSLPEDAKVKENLTSMLSVVSSDTKTDEKSVQARIAKIDQFAEQAKKDLKDRYSKPEDKTKLDAELKKIDQLSEVARTMTATGGDIKQIFEINAMQRKQVSNEQIAIIKANIEALKNNTDTVISLTSQSKQFKFDSLSNLLKVNFARTADIKSSMLGGIEADKSLYNNQIEIKQQDIEKISEEVKKAKEEVNNASSPEDKKIKMEALGVQQAKLDTSKGKLYELESQKMAAIAKRINDSLGAISTKFQLAAEAVDILRDRAENVAGTTEEWFRLENERLTLMYQEVNAMKDLIDTKEKEGISAEEKLKLQNQLSKKQLDFEKSKIGAQRNVFEKQLGAIIGNLQQSGAFRGVSKAAVFGAGYGENEAGMSAQNRRKGVIGYSDRLANANNFMFDDFNENTPTGRLGEAGDINSAASLHQKFTGKNIVTPNSSDSKKVLDEVSQQMDDINRKADRGEITSEQKDKEISKLNEEKKNAEQAKEISQMKTDDVFKSMLNYIINIEELLRTGKATVGTSTQSYNANGTTASANATGGSKKSSEKTKQDNSTQLDSAKSKSGAFQNLDKNATELSKRETYQKLLEDEKEKIKKTLERNDLSSDFRKGLQERLDKILKSEGTADKSGKTNKERISELKSKISVGEQLKEIYQNESIINDKSGKYSAKEKSDALSKLKAQKKNMDTRTATEYMAKKDEDVLSMRDQLATLDPKSKQAIELKKKIADSEKESFDTYSGLKGNDLNYAAVQKESDFTDRKEYIDRLSKGSIQDRETAKRLQKELDSDQDKNYALLQSRGVDIDSVVSASNKGTDLNYVNEQIQSADDKISALKNRGANAPLSAKEQDELRSLNVNRDNLLERRTKIQSREDFGFFGGKESSTQPDTRTVAEITRNSEDAKARFANTQGLEATALGEKDRTINTKGADGTKVDMSGATVSTPGETSATNMEIVLKLDNATLAKEIVRIVSGNNNFKFMHLAGGQISNRNTSA